MGDGDGITPRSEVTLLQLRTERMTEFVHADSALSSDIWNNGWEALRRHTPFVAYYTAGISSVCGRRDHKEHTKRVEKSDTRYDKRK